MPVSKRVRARRAALVAAAGLAAAVCAVAVAQAPAGDAKRGKALFTAYRCYACHGFTGETGSGPRLNPPPLDEAAFIAYVRSPATRYRGGGNVGGVMPPFAEDDVSDQDLADVYAYLVSLPSYSPPADGFDLDGLIDLP
jgi:mono/diheme cytochrome c family protein